MNEKCVYCRNDDDCEPLTIPVCAKPEGVPTSICVECMEDEDCEDTFWCSEYDACTCEPEGRCKRSWD